MNYTNKEEKQLEESNTKFFDILNKLTENGFKYGIEGNTIYFYHRKHLIVNDIDEEGVGDGFKLVKNQYEKFDKLFNVD